MVLCVVAIERWCRLRGNLLFYLKTRESWSEPVGVIVLENSTIEIDHTTHKEGVYSFYLGNYSMINPRED